MGPKKQIQMTHRIYLAKQPHVLMHHSQTRAKISNKNQSAIRLAQEKETLTRTPKISPIFQGLKDSNIDLK